MATSPAVNTRGALAESGLTNRGLAITKLPVAPNRQPPTSPVVIAFRVLHAASDRGANRDELCAEAGFDRAAFPREQGSVSVVTLCRLWAGAMKSLRSPGFPIDVAETFRPETYGVISLMAVTSQNMREAIDKVVRSYRLWTHSSCWRLENDDAVARLIFVQPGDFGLGQRCDQEFSLAEMVKRIRYVTGDERWAPLEVRFSHPRPSPSMDRHEAFFAAKLCFDCAHNALVLRSGDLKLPMLRADRLLAEFFEQHAQELLRRQGDTPEDILRVKAAILELMRGRVPRVKDVAAELGIGGRTLRRRLDDQGRSFKALIDETRSELARQYLEESRYSIQEIGYLLGFAESSTFHRAFKRWTNEAPQQFRDRMRRRSA
jgi:AraC-like DNA-binding protein